MESVPAPAVDTSAPATSAAPSLAPLPADWRPLPPPARTVFTIGGFLGGGMGGVILALFTGAIGYDDLGIRAIALALGVFVVFAVFGALRGRMRWKHTRWRLTDAGLEVSRGRFWQSETLVPRSRVQHLDIERGPIERRYGLATLSVHTAGTRLHALRQPGFADADAVALRDALLPEANRNDDAL